MFSFQGVPLNSLRFLFDGQRINDDQTPKDVSFFNDIIEESKGVVFFENPKTDFAFFWRKPKMDHESKVSTLEEDTSDQI